jgi:hypothetical protein
LYIKATVRGGTSVCAVYGDALYSPVRHITESTRYKPVIGNVPLPGRFVLPYLVLYYVYIYILCRTQIVLIWVTGILLCMSWLEHVSCTKYRSINHSF